MKMNFFKAFILSLIVVPSLHAFGVRFNLSPTNVSTAYNGVLTLNVTGLTNTEKVIVQSYLDLNGNGIIDAGEPLVDMFKTGDGNAMIIGGVTNINVPF